MPRRLLPKEKLRDKHVDVYLSQVELAAVQSKAKETGLRLAEFVRACALSKKVQAVAAANPLIWASLAPTCANLNQLAKHANEGRVTNIPPDLLIELHEKVQALRMTLLGEAP